MAIRVRYNAPLILSFALASLVVLVLDSYLLGSKLTATLFSSPPSLYFSSPASYFRLFSYVLGHANWAHLMGNFSFILLIGPLIEERYGSLQLFFMSMVAAGTAGVLNVFFFNSILIGASGIAFMLIVLGSFTNFRRGEIPLTFVLILVLFLGKEVVNAWQQDNISQFGHILGGTCGAAFGFLFARKGQPPVSIGLLSHKK